MGVFVFFWGVEGEEESEIFKTPRAGGFPLCAQREQ